MKIYLASYMQIENHGPGRKIGITTNKPNNLEVIACFLPFTPEDSVINKYKEIQKESQENASKFFNDYYEHKLIAFFSTVSEFSDLPFKDGDTLLSWERKEYTSYRPTLARHLEKFGYEVILN